MVCLGPGFRAPVLLHCELECLSSSLSGQDPLGYLAELFSHRYLASLVCITTSLSFSFQSKDKMKRGTRRGCFQLKQAIIGIDDEEDSTFTIGVDSRIYHFQGECEM